MTINQTVNYIESHGWSNSRTGLKRTYELLNFFCNPHKKLKFVHVAGSNGKGSTCAMLESILRAAGYKTGLYTSPYIESFSQRIRFNGENIPDEDLCELITGIKPFVDGMEDRPSQFEITTAIAMEYFCKQNCDIVVLEVGMGGVLDSTNVIDMPEVAVITNIGLEHTEYLGSTYAEIAKNKAGIIKTGCNCVCYNSYPEAVSVIKNVCEEKNVPIVTVDFSDIVPLSQSLEGQSFSYKNNIYYTGLLGRHQLYNCAVVLETVGVLIKRGFNIPDSAIKSGLEKVKWPARLEILNRKPLFILDGGHNPQCARALCNSIKELFPGKKVIILAGMLADKDYKKVIEFIKPVSKEFVCVTPPSPRALKAEDFKKCLSNIGIKAEACNTVGEGVEKSLETAKNENLPVVCFGSLYLAGEVRSYCRRIFPDIE